eukprot:CAMPEP_0119369794 /NCGR_PEP_ID=MMETSP1334-20130426/16265_1 /TAXON_ID=127549 /ORGANISM="Calcidiscus leptoporus, Strain RCC1130" /LENGTH=228 /DNA_ID=CAMNT_0007386709 /DNA_START=52 /DNA_END=738 /DNA_ORIENTATION=+
MFRLARLRDVIHIQPAEFAKRGEDERRVLFTTITEALNEKYPNKIIPDVGLCIALHEILDVGEARLFQGSAAQHLSVEFRVVVFRPFVGQVLTGKVASCDLQGVRITMGFFDDIFVPTTHLQKPSRWSSEEGLWVWALYPDNPLYLDLENKARFRVIEVCYPQPPGPPEACGRDESLPAMRIVAAIDEPGLGLVDWWPEDLQDDGEEAGEEVGEEEIEEHEEEDSAHR